MRVRRKAAFGLQFAAKILQFLLGNAAFEISASIDSRGGVALKIDQVAVPALGPCTEKMVERDFL
jgi:hypothetical protein